MRNYELAKQSWLVVCKWFQNCDANGCHLDNIDERSNPENLLSEADLYSNMTQEWYREGFITIDEHSYLMAKISMIRNNLEVA